jgi:predicted chitinase
MKKSFESRLEAIEWLANKVENEGQFEVLREQLNYSFIYNGTYIIKLENIELFVELIENGNYFLGEPN